MVVAPVHLKVEVRTPKEVVVYVAVGNVPAATCSCDDSYKLTLKYVKCSIKMCPLHCVKWKMAYNLPIEQSQIKLEWAFMKCTG